MISANTASEGVPTTRTEEAVNETSVESRCSQIGLAINRGSRLLLMPNIIWSHKGPVQPPLVPGRAPFDRGRTVLRSIGEATGSWGLRG